jgi:hypothetical protein
MPDIRPEPGSFRDRNGRIFYDGGRVLRGISESAWQDFRKLESTPFFSRYVGEGKLVNTRTSSRPVTGSWSAVLEHEPIPFISYPYEWAFGMLKDSALLQLELLLAALDHDLILKDASAFNVQWRGARPVFIDIPSFTRLSPGEPWAGYRQFCQLLLYPLMLQAYKNVDFRPFLRGSLDGITPGAMNRMTTAADLFLRAGVFAHVFLQSKLESNLADSGFDMRKGLREAGFAQDLIRANASRLKKLVSSLQWNPPGSEWSGYADRNSYTDSDTEAKKRFVAEVGSMRRKKLSWDIGCNTGTYSRILAESSGTVVAMDRDPLAIEWLYRALAGEKNGQILPLVTDITDPSPALGWKGMERKALWERGRPELTLCLALIHHVVISANIPMHEFIAWLAGLGTALVIEFVRRGDPMVQKLLRNKADQYADYDEAAFERCLQEHFSIERRLELGSRTRVLYFATPVSATPSAQVDQPH